MNKYERMWRAEAEELLRFGISDVEDPIARLVWLHRQAEREERREQRRAVRYELMGLPAEDWDLSSWSDAMDVVFDDR